MRITYKEVLSGLLILGKTNLFKIRNAQRMNRNDISRD